VIGGNAFTSLSKYIQMMRENQTSVVLQFDKFGSKTNVMPAPCQARGKLQLASSAQFSGFGLSPE
ncbi:MAG: hypothetical protein KGJ59_08170, partial [Bacteroidota bacterium]|nr:hypothetical protein [Bacteroidota bacterium]